MKLEEIKKLCEASTPAPWHYDGYDVMEADTPCIIATPQSDANGLFIAAARDLLPKLLAVAEALQSVVAEEGVKESLCCYVQGVVLLDALAVLEAE